MGSVASVSASETPLPQLPTLAAVQESASSEPASSSRSDQVSGQGKLREPRS